MRFLHSADWHLGKLFYGQHLTEDQAYVMEQQFFPLLKEAKIEAILLAGDVFDRSVPPVEAIELWDSIVTKVAMDFKIPFIVIGGNHDSGERLSVGRELLYKSGLYMEGSIRMNHGPIRLDDGHGPVHICPLPFSEPHFISKLIGDGSLLSYEEAYALYRDAMMTHVPQKDRKIAISHCFLTGGKSCESERTLSVGGSDQISKDVFAPFNYTALGHLHGPQTFTGAAGPIHYSGSLLKYSFDEANHKKGFTIIDMDKEGQVTMERVPIGALRDVRLLRGTFEEIYEGTLYKAQAEECLSYDDYLLAELTDEGPVIDAINRLRQVYPNIRAINPIGRLTATQEGEQITYKKLKEEELFSEFAQYIWQEPLTEEEARYVQELWNRSIEEEL